MRYALSKGEFDWNGRIDQLRLDDRRTLRYGLGASAEVALGWRTDDGFPPGIKLLDVGDAAGLVIRGAGLVAAIVASAVTNLGMPRKPFARPFERRVRIGLLVILDEGERAAATVLRLMIVPTPVPPIWLGWLRVN